jgi:ATP-dependent DNA ligase
MALQTIGPMLERHPALTRRPAELCQLAGVWRGDVEAGGTWCEPKIDGVRAIWRESELVTREGVAIHGAEHIRTALLELEAIAGRPLVFDGEFQVAGSYLATLQHVGKGAKADSAGTLWLFDVLPLEVWHGDDDDEPLHKRKAFLAALSAEWEARQRAARSAWDWAGHTRQKGPIRIMRDEWLPDAAAVHARAQEVWAADGEGLMLKDWEAPYRRSRSNAWRKVKREGWATRSIRSIEGMTGQERTGI